MIKCYSELKHLKTFEERFKYLKLNSSVGSSTFGFDRILNQTLYKSKAWRDVRDQVILRDQAQDLGIVGRDIYDKVIVHHMNPITVEDLEKRMDKVLDPEYLICVSHRTHNAIHFGDERLIDESVIIERTRNDTCPWL